MIFRFNFFKTLCIILHLIVVNKYKKQNNSREKALVISVYFFGSFFLKAGLIFSSCQNEKNSQ